MNIKFPSEEEATKAAFVHANNWSPLIADRKHYMAGFSTAITYLKSLAQEQGGERGEGKPTMQRRKYMRDQAICVLELVKGFTGEPNTNAGKCMLEMVDYVMELTAYDYLQSPTPSNQEQGQGEEPRFIPYTDSPSDGGVWINRHLLKDDQAQKDEREKVLSSVPPSEADMKWAKEKIGEYQTLQSQIDSLRKAVAILESKMKDK